LNSANIFLQIKITNKKKKKQNKTKTKQNKTNKKHFKKAYSLEC
jgi:hypothetical protein